MSGGGGGGIEALVQAAAAGLSDRAKDLLDSGIPCDAVGTVRHSVAHGARWPAVVVLAACADTCDVSAVPQWCEEVPNIRLIVVCVCVSVYTFLCVCVCVCVCVRVHVRRVRLRSWLRLRRDTSPL